MILKGRGFQRLRENYDWTQAVEQAPRNSEPRSGGMRKRGTESAG